MKPIVLADLWTYQVAVLAEKISRHTAEVARKEGLTVAQWRVLAAIAEVPGRTAKQVEDITPMDKASISRAVRHLIQTESVTRRSSDADGRIAHLHLTAKGEKLYDLIAPEIKSHANEMIRRLAPEERTAFRGVLKNLVEGFGGTSAGRDN
ncbi:MAG: MarR family transcriptional regulator [Rhodobacteraceae bacterium]|nr:MarR family transcriptional regulator [Paracoccaceae bacterium]